MSPNLHPRPTTRRFDCLGFKWVKKIKKRLFSHKKHVVFSECSERAAFPLSISCIQSLLPIQTTIPCSNDENGEDENTPTASDRTYTYGVNPLLHYPVGKCIFDFLSFSCIQKCCLVCQEWNSTGQIFLRTRGTIYFKPNLLRPANFLRKFQNSLYTLPFSAFTINIYNVGQEHVSELNDFFIKWGSNIKKLTLYCLEWIQEKGNYPDIINYDVTPWILNTPNLIYLRIESSSINTLKVQWNKLPTKISHLELVNCVVRSEYNNDKKIKPLKITLDGTRFRFQEHDIIGQFIDLKDFIDFSQASEITIQNYQNGLHTNLANQEFNTQLVRLWEPIFGQVDLQGSSGNIFKLDLHNCKFLEQPDVCIKHLIVKNHQFSTNVAFLPLSLEKLQLKSEMILHGGRGPIQLINLKSLRLDILEYSTVLNQMYSFSEYVKSDNLVELELRGSGKHFTLHLSLLPKSVKRLKLVVSYTIFNISEGKNFEKIDLDILTLDNSNQNLNDLFDFARNFVSKINLKVLVVSCNTLEPFIPGRSTTGIIQFVKASQHLEKIIIGYGHKHKNKDLHNIPFEGSVLSQFVDRKANFYQFEKLVGKSLSLEEFQRYRKSWKPEMGQDFT